MHIQLGLEYLADRRDMHTSEQVYRCIHDLSTDFMNNLFTGAQQMYEGQHRVTRSQSSNDLIVPRSRTNMGERRFEVRGSRNWNRVDGETKSSTSLAILKNKLKKSAPIAQLTLMPV